MKNKKLISLIPNLLTSLALLMGLLAIFNIINTSFNYKTFLGFEKPLWWSCIFIYTAAFIDFLDGKIARLLNKDSVFGMHYDSLCDLISFGFFNRASSNIVPIFISKNILIYVTLQL